MEKFLYLCDGKVEDCTGSFLCYRNGGPCKHTTDILHRMKDRPPVCMDLFERSESPTDIFYFEKDN